MVARAPGQTFIKTSNPSIFEEYSASRAARMISTHRWKERFPKMRRIMHKADVKSYGDTGNVEVLRRPAQDVT